jgi:hypothetical protein
MLPPFADPDSFRVLGGPPYDFAKDVSHAYYKGIPIPTCDLETFYPLLDQNNAQTGYSRDKDCVFFSSGQSKDTIKLINADPAKTETRRQYVPPLLSDP